MQAQLRLQKRRHQKQVNKTKQNTIKQNKTTTKSINEKHGLVRNRHQQKLINGRESTRGVTAAQVNKRDQSYFSCMVRLAEWWAMLSSRASCWKGPMSQNLGQYTMHLSSKTEQDERYKHTPTNTDGVSEETL